jgi:hypothetical protein
MWLRLRQIALVSDSLTPVLADLHSVFGLEVAFRDPGVKTFGLENMVIPVGTQFIEVVAPVQEGTTAGRYLQRRNGPGGYMVITHTDEHARRKERAAELGVRTVLEFDHDDYNCLQLHPADTGGSFLEIDHQAGGEDPQGPWEPAGPNWQKAQRTQVVDGIRAVGLQAADPGQVAQRWSDITEIPLETRGEASVLTLDNAEVHFVPLADDRGEGLASMELSAVDAGAARSAAEKRDLIDGDGNIVIGGVKFTLV